MSEKTEVNNEKNHSMHELFLNLHGNFGSFSAVRGFILQSFSLHNSPPERAASSVP